MPKRHRFSAETFADRDLSSVFRMLNFFGSEIALAPIWNQAGNEKMSIPGDKKWIIKTPGGRVLGPFPTDEVLAKIRRGEFVGEEQISLFPNTDWFPISSAPEFYDQLLASLEGEKPKEHSGSEEMDSSEDSSESRSDEKHGSFSQTPTPSIDSVNRAKKVSFKSGSEQSKDSSKNSSQKSDPGGEIIELRKTKKVLRKAKVKSGSKPIFLLVVVLVLAAVFLTFKGESNRSALRLVVPRLDQAPLSAESLKALTQKAVNEFTLNDYDNLVAAQNSLVQVFEGDNKNSAALALLCLTYLDLWPFSYQDSQDLGSLTKLTQIASQVDPAGADGSTCRTVDLIVRGRPQEAASLVDSVIETLGASETPPIVFYYLKAVLLGSKKEFNSAINYAQAAEQLWPNWMAPKILQGELALRGSQADVAIKSLNSVLKSNPKHGAAQALLGIVEARELKNIDRGESFLEAALQSPEKLPPAIASDSYLAVAEIALHRGDNSRALSFAKLAFSKNSTNQRARALVVQLGGEKSLRDTKLVDRQLIYEGDQLVREGDCSSAQALFKSAYELNQKNAMAAVKAAECLWRMGLGTESIDWLNKAVGADPKFIDAYVLLSDYYSQRYLFQAASRALATANSIDPNNYKVFRGLARLELRRRNGQGAVAYADQAVALYEGDVESYVILAKAHIILNDFNQAIVASRKAIEMDINNRDAQIVFAESLFGAQGATVAIDYMTRLVGNYPLVSDYRLALGDLYLKDQNYKDAKTLFEQVIRMEDKPKEALLHLGDAEKADQKFEEAFSAYLKAAALDPSDPEPLFQAGQLYLANNKPSEARQQFERILNINKEYPLVNYSIGKAALLMGSPKDALEQAKLEMQKNPKLADPYILAAEAHDQMGQYNLCASEYQKAVKLRPQGSMMYVRMARCYRLSGNLDAASSMINIANTQESGNPELWKEQGLIFESKGDAIRAVEAYNQYLVLAPNAADAAQVQGRIQALSQ